MNVLYEDVEVPGQEPPKPPEKCPDANLCHVSMEWFAAKRRWEEWDKKKRRYNLAVGACGPEVSPNGVLAQRRLLMMLVDEVLRAGKEP